MYLRLSFRLIYLLFFSKEKGATKSNSRTNTESNSTTKNQGEFSSRYVAMHIVVNFSCDPGSGVGSGQTRFILNDEDNAFLNRFFQVKL